jgi:CheY-like chemotaxis protein
VAPSARRRFCSAGNGNLRALATDVVVSDIGMPGEDGYALIGRIRARGAAAGGDVPALALTAYARADDRARAIAAGFQMHIAKPVDPSELGAAVARLVS